MIGMDSNYHQILGKTLAGEREVDEQAFASLAILTERLERLKKLGSDFSRVAFSPDVKKLQNQKNAVAV